MKIIYRADDGKDFENEDDCLMYEWSLKFGDSHFYSLSPENEVPLMSLYSEEIYGIVDKIVVDTNKSAKAISAFGKWSGFLAYISINSVGTWIYDESSYEFVKVD